MRAKPKSRVDPHLLAPDPHIPADHRGRRRCTVCGLMGEDGDSHHPTRQDQIAAAHRRPITPDLAAAARARDAAILGERDDDE